VVPEDTIPAFEHVTAAGSDTEQDLSVTKKKFSCLLMNRASVRTH